ncbi:MAG: hypothetical protein KAQ79_08590, partial [Cyclobacteriaceae bacterium]|nr:hypothetical protein [Cyclobacteriaceae bacterium]
QRDELSDRNPEIQPFWKKVLSQNPPTMCDHLSFEVSPGNEKRKGLKEVTFMSKNSWESVNTDKSSYNNLLF